NLKPLPACTAVLDGGGDGLRPFRVDSSADGPAHTEAPAACDGWSWGLVWGKNATRPLRAPSSNGPPRPEARQPAANPEPPPPPPAERPPPPRAPPPPPQPPNPPPRHAPATTFTTHPPQSKAGASHPRSDRCRHNVWPRRTQRRRADADFAVAR